MNRKGFPMTHLVPVLLFFLMAAAGQAQPHLVFSHVIATDWQPDAHGWMNFVAISSDGRTVAANGNVPGREAAGAGLWTFPAGDYLGKIKGDPIAISPDFRYLATENSVQELQTGKIIFQISQQLDVLRNATFSPSGENVA